ncbi:hypothetical protein K435DRAFT_785468 [Dendrothele bispora CBS 962.96]|uniref:Uncharacterized protein n=1 Tax=Dendrothele bispora (strain CBS 962.96) TaxID=1314807 RepID=A0A4S8KWN0_DENBC|nr:hypothetical protein K435DRAFT_785468 [Dendrothele bispora CBS 962.96]
MAQILPALSLVVPILLALLFGIWFRLPPDAKVRVEIELRCILFPCADSYRLARSVLRQASSYEDFYDILTPEDFANRFGNGDYRQLSEGPASDAYELYKRCRRNQSGSEDSWLWSALASQCIKVMIAEHCRGMDGSVNDTIPQANDAIPQTDNAIPQTDNDIPQTDNDIPQTDNAVPQTDNAIPQSDNAIPQSDNAIPQSNNAVPQSDNAIPQSDNAIPQTNIAIHQTNNTLPSEVLSVSPVHSPMERAPERAQEEPLAAHQNSEANSAHLSSVRLPSSVQMNFDTRRRSLFGRRAILPLPVQMPLPGPVRSPDLYARVRSLFGGQAQRREGESYPLVRHSFRPRTSHDSAETCTRV